MTSPRKTAPEGLNSSVGSRTHGAATRAKILDVAEELFAQRGYTAVSIRSIAARADVNNGVMVYYFKTKADLFEAVYRRLVEPVMEARRRLLENVLSGPDRHDVYKLVEAALRPVFEQSRKNPNYRLIAGRSTTDPTPEVRAAIEKVHSPKNVMFHKALRSACPDLSHEEFYWRYYCLHGGVQYILADIGRIQSIAGVDFDTSDPELALRYVVPHFAEGMLRRASDT